MARGRVGRMLSSRLARLVRSQIASAVAFVAFKIASLTVGLRVSEEQEREGLDIHSHGESAYDY